MANQTELAQFRALLEAAEEVRLGPNHVCTFDLQSFPATDGVEDVLATLARNTNWIVTVSESSWHEVERAFDLWLRDRAPDALSRIRSVVGDHGIVQRVHSSPPAGESMVPWYEAAWDDFLFSSSEEHLLLHLGVSD